MYQEMEIAGRMVKVQMAPVETLRVREDGPDACGASIPLEAGCVYRRDRRDAWTTAKERITIYLVNLTDVVEVYHPDTQVLKTYEAISW